MIFQNQSDVFARLQTDILRLQGFRMPAHVTPDSGLGPICEAFPNGIFPTGAVHEFLSSRIEDTAATAGFITGLLSALMMNNGTALWISSTRSLFPPALKTFGIEPDRIIFIDLQKEKDVIWAMDEALKCGAITAVIGEVNTLSFIESRRLQLAVEQSHVTGFVLRHQIQNINTTACVSRWRITSLPSITVDDLPGIGFPQWRVELMRMRNGKTGTWDMQWRNGKFIPVQRTVQIKARQSRKTG